MTDMPSSQDAGHPPLEMAPTQDDRAENLTSTTPDIKETLTMSSELNDEGGSLEAGNDVDRGIIVNASDMHDDLIPQKKRKKRAKKPASKRGLGKPTGFEDFHADGPLTPEQYAESKEAFSPNLPFVDRILKAIQRFERTRKLSPERRDIFYKYLAYGGVDVGPNMFVGAQNTEDMDKDQLNTTMAQASISDATKQAIVDPKETSEGQQEYALGGPLHSTQHMAKYVVDFESTMRGFLSRHAPTIYLFDTQNDVKIVTTTLERFMDYLLQHDVCLEYGTEVLKTRNLCRSAQTELWHCVEAQRNLPGDFNIACSTLFGGSYGQNYDGETYWGPSEMKGDVFVGLKPEQATQIIGFAIAGAATEEVYTKYLDITTGDSAGNDFEVIKTIEEHGFEITQIEQPSEECKTLYKENTTEFRPVGRVHAKYFQNPDAAPEDLTPAERAALDTTDPNETKNNHAEEFIFLIEADPLLTLLRPGMRIEATIHQLNCGVWFFDQVLRVLPSFDIWLENELMLGWKEPRPVAGAPHLKWNINGTAEDTPSGEQDGDIDAAHGDEISAVGEDQEPESDAIAGAASGHDDSGSYGDHRTYDAKNADTAVETHGNEDQPY